MSLKIEIARRQLGMATHLYLPDLDPVSVHCLANAGCELIKLYAKKLRGKAILSKTSARRFHQASTPAPVWIAFKQATEQGKPDAERDDDGLLKHFSCEKNDLALVIGWADYHLAT
jgi:hypothetical protein